MKVSMNGLRRNLMSDIEELKHIVERVISGDYHDTFDRANLINAMNSVICDANVLNCIFNANDEHFSDMSHVELELISEPSESDDE